jgi:4-diphosphocytidyl-2-C-methyl-D-erythritol kinase
MDTGLIYRAESPAKVNLFLHVTGKRDDGYHELHTLFCGVTLHDTLEIEQSERTEIICNDASIPTDAENIIMKVDAILRQSYPTLPHYRINLEKQIPTGAGLGVGSSNACAYLRLVNEAAGLNLSITEMEHILMQVGSDTCFFLHLPAAIGRGRGELLEPVETLPELSILLINPGIHVSTATIYSKLKLMLTEKVDAFNMPFQINLHQLIELMHNDLELVVFKEYPLVESLCRELEVFGAAKALMSGSGSTVFGLYMDDVARDMAYSHFVAKYPDYIIEKANSLTRADFMQPIAV